MSGHGFTPRPAHVEPRRGIAFFDDDRLGLPHFRKPPNLSQLECPSGSPPHRPCGRLECPSGPSPHQLIFSFLHLLFCPSSWDACFLSTPMGFRACPLTPAEGLALLRQRRDLPSHVLAASHFPITGRVTAAQNSYVCTFRRVFGDPYFFIRKF